MPVTYRIDVPRKMIRTVASGPVTLPEVVDHFRALEEDPEIPEKLDVLLDLRQVTSLPESAQVSLVVDEMRNLRPHLHFGICAIVVWGDALFGMMRMFEAFAEEMFDATRTFRSAAEAEEWLATQQSQG